MIARRVGASERMGSTADFALGRVAGQCRRHRSARASAAMLRDDDIVQDRELGGSIVGGAPSAFLCPPPPARTAGCDVPGSRPIAKGRSGLVGAHFALRLVSLPSEPGCETLLEPGPAGPQAGHPISTSTRPNPSPPLSRHIQSPKPGCCSTIFLPPLPHDLLPIPPPAARRRVGRPGTPLAARYLVRRLPTRALPRRRRPRRPPPPLGEGSELVPDSSPPFMGSTGHRPHGPP